MALVVIGIDTDVAILDGLKAPGHLIVITTAGLITVIDEVDLARLDVENQSGVMTHGQTGPNAVLFTHSLDSGSQFRFAFLGDISHDLLPFL